MTCKCGAPTKRSSICRDCRRAIEQRLQRPDILQRLFPCRIVRQLERLNIELQQKDLDALNIEGRGLYLYGPTGTGKTLYGCELFTQLVPPVIPYVQNIGFLFTTVEGMLEDIKSSFNTNRNDVVGGYKTIDYLLLDDLGLENLTDWVYSSLYSIINYRYDNLLPTIFTCNLTLNEIADRMGDERVPDRIYEMCKLVPFEGKSKRQKEQS